MLDRSRDRAVGESGGAPERRRRESRASGAGGRNPAGPDGVMTDLLEHLPRWTLLMAGAVAGVRHALEPDHVAAVSAFATRAAHPAEAARVAAQWALGHGL